LVTFSHDGSEAGSASFAVAVEDGNEDGSAPASRAFNFTVTPINDAPVAVANTVSTNEDTATAGLGAILKANDTDAENNTLTITGVSNATHGSVSLNGGNPI